MPIAGSMDRDSGAWLYLDKGVSTDNPAQVHCKKFESWIYLCRPLAEEEEEKRDSWAADECFLAPGASQSSKIDPDLTPRFLGKIGNNLWGAGVGGCSAGADEKTARLREAPAVMGRMT
ncbi:hypothetical protein JZ751_007478 [Albula glossodonta]|uniref:Uncharacterized protein n=1 Tax=Albula glossodonta TaxID=121402 RepID=A0A8T2NA35_9TELE|nr:hypothetical protein JZ751_007478 [Albula glossodonta]